MILTMSKYTGRYISNLTKYRIVAAYVFLLLLLLNFAVYNTDKQTALRSTPAQNRVY